LWLTILSFNRANAAPQEPMVRQSSLIFVGTVRKLNATTVPTVPASASTAVVRVDEVVYNAGVVTDIAGKDITVELLAPGSVTPRQRAVFYTNVDAYGDSIAVREVAHEELKTGGAAAMQAQTAEVTKRLADEKLQARIAQADLIVTGRVTAVQPSEGNARRAPRSEHDPEWWEATLKVQTVEKGQASPGDLTVLFPHSKDVRWFGSPKFEVNQDGIFLLHRTEDKQLRASGYTALHALDFQALDQRDRIKAMVQNSR
jgi:hypothetical protein